MRYIPLSFSSQLNLYLGVSELLISGEEAVKTYPFPSLSNEKIAKIMQQPKTKVDHWFRKDSSGSLPSIDDYKKLKEILSLDTKYDKQLLSYEEKEIKYEQSLRITNWDRPSDTITATGPEIHINKKRRLSVREVARLQTFPEDFVFTGSLDKMYRQVGNAVPVELALLVAREIINKL